MKLTCSKCGNYREPDRLYGYRYCNACHAEWQRLYRPKYSELNTNQKKKAVARSYSKTYLKRGVLTRQPCEKCGYEVTQFHHEDYNKPLEVNNLCRPCHLDLHKTRELEVKDVQATQPIEANC